ncbi:unnamed protein product [Amaranthus hypochondriacus]
MSEVAELTSSHHQPRLPDKLVQEILIRLPVRTIFRFKTISRTWNSIISSPYFKTSYLSRNPTPLWFIVERSLTQKSVPNSQKYTTQLYFQEPPKLSTLLMIFPEIVDLPISHPTLLASSNGLLFIDIMCRYQPSMFLITAITNNILPVETPDWQLYDQMGVGLITQIDNTNGFIEKFVIVYVHPINESEVASLNCYSSVTLGWEFKLGELTSGEDFFITGSVRVFEFNGKLFWYDLGFGLIAWDDPFSNEYEIPLRFIQFPIPQMKEYEDERCLDCGGGCIQFLELSKRKNGEISLWGLSYECEIWTLVRKLYFPGLDCRPESVMPTPIFIHPFNGDVVFFEFGNSIFSLNLTSRKMEFSYNFGNNAVFPSSVTKSWVPVLLSSWPIISFSPIVDARLMLKYGDVVYDEGNFNEAINLYTHSINSSESAITYVNRASAYMRLSKNKEAEVDFAKALELHGECFEVYERRAFTRLKGCVEDLESALKLKPDHQDFKELHTKSVALFMEWK